MEQYILNIIYSDSLAIETGVYTLDYEYVRDMLRERYNQNFTKERFKQFVTKSDKISILSTNEIIHINYYPRKIFQYELAEKIIIDILQSPVYNSYNGSMKMEKLNTIMFEKYNDVYSDTIKFGVRWNDFVEYNCPNLKMISYNKYSKRVCTKNNQNYKMNDWVGYMNQLLLQSFCVKKILFLITTNPGISVYEIIKLNKHNNPLTRMKTIDYVITDNIDYYVNAKCMTYPGDLVKFIKMHSDLFYITSKYAVHIRKELLK